MRPAPLIDGATYLLAGPGGETAGRYLAQLDAFLVIGVGKPVPTSAYEVLRPVSSGIVARKERDRRERREARIARNRSIMRDLLAGATLAATARKHGLSPTSLSGASAWELFRHKFGDDPSRRCVLCGMTMTESHEAMGKGGYRGDWCPAKRPEDYP